MAAAAEGAEEGGSRGHNAMDADEEGDGGRLVTIGEEDDKILGTQQTQKVLPRPSQAEEEEDEEEEYADDMGEDEN